MTQWVELETTGLATARLVLSAVFLAAGGANLIDRSGGRQALISFGAPSRVAPALALALPAAELAVAFALIPASLAWFGAIGALSLLLLFAAAIGLNLAKGRKPDCHCFGQLHSAPAGWSTLARNAALASAAGLLVWQGKSHPGPNLGDWVAGLAASAQVSALIPYLVLALVVGQAVLLFQLMKQQGRILLRLDALAPRSDAEGAAQAAGAGLAAGSPAPGFGASALGGEVITLAGLLADAKPVLLLFTNPGCGPCQALLPEISRWREQNLDKVTLALISEGGEASNRARTAGLTLDKVLLQQTREIADAYGVAGTPAAVAIRQDGLIASPVAYGADAIRALLATLASGPRPAAAPDPRGSRVPVVPPAAPGEPAPGLELPDLEGDIVDLAAFRGDRVLLLFWNARCGFCQRMLGDLQNWELNRPAGAPNLVVVLAGAEEDGRAMGLRAPILLDPSGGTGARFGANGTPMAVLIDAEGRLASDVAAGAERVFDLAGRHREIRRVAET